MPITVPEQIGEEADKATVRTQVRLLRDVIAQVVERLEGRPVKIEKPSVPQWSQSTERPAGKWRRISAKLMVDRTGFSHLISRLDDKQVIEIEEDLGENALDTDLEPDDETPTEG